MPEQQAVDDDFLRKIFFSNDADFSLGWCINKQIFLIWCSENSQTIDERLLQPIGLYFFENDNGGTVTVYSEHCGRMIINFSWPTNEENDLDKMWFQQNGARCHTTQAKTVLLREKFSVYLLSRLGDVSWPTRSCDFSSLGLFFFG